MTAGILLSQAVTGFLLARAADGYSPSTISQYKWVLERLIAQGDKPVEHITTHDLRGLLASVQSLAPMSVYHVWKGVRAFYKWAAPELNIPRPDLALTRPRYVLPEVKPLTVEEVKKLLKAVERTAPAKGRREGFTMSRPQANRDKAILLVLLDTGLRASELCRLLVRDADLTSGLVTVQPYRSGLKSRPRLVPLGQSARKAIWRYLADRRPLASDPLFLTNNEKPLDRGQLLHLLVRLGERAGVTKCHPHRFRHTFAIQYLRNGGDVFTLQRLLGHTSLETVRHYLALAEADDETAHRRASPADNWRL
jgi:integrase/recombinase XerD